jgi:DNA modification methylase
VEIVQRSLFDYGSLDSDTRAFVQEKAHAIQTRLKRTAEDIIAIGLDLLAVKERLQHGQFIPWLQAEFGMSDRHALNFMRVASRFSSKSEIISDLPVTVLYELAAPSTPDAVIEQVVTGQVPATLPAIIQAKRVEAYKKSLECDMKRLARLDDPMRASIAEKLATKQAATLKEATALVKHEQVAQQHEVLILPQSVQLLHGDFYEEIQHIAPGCIDLILTDPPYNVASNRVFTFDDRSPISQDFGDWDKVDRHEFISLFALWAKEWLRILKPGGSGYVFTSDRYLSHLRDALEDTGFHIKATLYWHKTNPGFQVVHTNFKSSVEIILFFTKCQGGHTFNWLGENEMQNFIETSICQGDERLKDNLGHTLHPTQKPESVLAHLLRISSNPGDTIFDGFAGVGSVAAVCMKYGRKFIGIEQDPIFFEAMERRIAG